MANDQDGYAHHMKGSDRTLFKRNYRRPTDFGLEKVRYDPKNSVISALSTETTLVFEINTQTDTADLLLDTHLVLDLPDIWSPIHADKVDVPAESLVWRPFEFKWVRNLGSTIIKDVDIEINNTMIQKNLDGHYMRNLVEREFSDEKKAFYHEMTGNVPELYDPASMNDGYYPHASHLDAQRRTDADPLYEVRVEPSIRGRKLIIPIMGWYYFSTKQAVPLCCLREAVPSQLMKIRVTLRPLREWYVLKCVDPYVAQLPDPARPSGKEPFKPKHVDSHVKRKHRSPQYINDSGIPPHYNLNRFMVEPPSKEQWKELNEASSELPDYRGLSLHNYYETRGNANYDFDIHLVATKATLSPEERNEFLYNRKEYLFKQVVKRDPKEGKFGVPLISKLRLEGLGHAANISIFLQRHDVNERNEYDNYTMQAYLGEREDPLSEREGSLWIPKTSPYYEFNDEDGDVWDLRRSDSEFTSDDNLFRTTGNYLLQNRADILRSFTFHFEGAEKESQRFSHVISSIDRFMRCDGGGGGSHSRHVHFYSFELSSSPFDATPSGYLNTDYFNRVEIEYTLNPPPVNKDYEFKLLCDADNNIQFVDKHKADMYEFHYNMYIYVEKWQKLRFENGEVGLVFPS